MFRSSVKERGFRKLTATPSRWTPCRRDPMLTGPAPDHSSISCRITFLSILPTLVLGTSFTSMIYSGIAHFEILSLKAASFAVVVNDYFLILQTLDLLFHGNNAITE